MIYKIVLKCLQFPGNEPLPKFTYNDVFSMVAILGSLIRSLKSFVSLFMLRGSVCYIEKYVLHLCTLRIQDLECKNLIKYLIKSRLF